MTGFRTMLLVSLIAHSLLLLLPSEDPQVEQVVYASENSLVMMIRHPSPAAAPEVVPGEKKTRLEPELQSPPPKKQQPSEKRVLPKPTRAQLNRKSTPSTENTLAAQVPKEESVSVEIKGPPELSPRLRSETLRPEIPQQQASQASASRLDANGSGSRYTERPSAVESVQPSPPVWDVPFGSSEGPDFAKRVLPRYPLAAQRRGLEGTVLLRLSIDAVGLLKDAEVIQSAGMSLDQAALEAVRASSFYPARRDGCPVYSTALLPIRFRLNRR